MRPSALLTLLASLTLLVPGSAEANPVLELEAKALVQAPQTKRPMHQRRFDFENPAEGRITLAWQAVDKASAYQVQLSSEADFSKLLNAAQQFLLSEEHAAVDLVGLPVGGYYWRVAAIDGEGRRGSWCETRVFSINEGAPEEDGDGPTIKITSTTPVGSKVIVRGTTNTDGRVESWVNGVPGEDVAVNLDGTFSVMLDANLIGKNKVRLIAVDTRGRASFAETSFRYSGN